MVNGRLKTFLTDTVCHSLVIIPKEEVAGGALLKAARERISACFPLVAYAVSLAPLRSPPFFRRPLLSFFLNNENLFILILRTVAVPVMIGVIKVAPLHLLKPGVWL